MKKAMLSLLSTAIGAVVGTGITGSVMEKSIKKNNAMSNKHLSLLFDDE